jgi:hypothetical protein
MNLTENFQLVTDPAERAHVEAFMKNILKANITKGDTPPAANEVILVVLKDVMLRVPKYRTFVPEGVVLPEIEVAPARVAKVRTPKAPSGDVTPKSSPKTFDVSHTTITSFVADGVALTAETWAEAFVASVLHVESRGTVLPASMFRDAATKKTITLADGRFLSREWNAPWFARHTNRVLALGNSAAVVSYADKAGNVLTVTLGVGATAPVETAPAPVVETAPVEEPEAIETIEAASVEAVEEPETIEAVETIEAASVEEPEASEAVEEPEVVETTEA